VLVALLCPEGSRSSSPAGSVSSGITLRTISPMQFDAPDEDEVEQIINNHQVG
jgi:hypothetical protein